MTCEHHKNLIKELKGALAEGIISPRTLIKDEDFLLHLKSLVLDTREISPMLKLSYIMRFFALLQLIGAAVEMCQTKEQARNFPHILKINKKSGFAYKLTEQGQKASQGMQAALENYNKETPEKILPPTNVLKNIKICPDTSAAYKDYLGLREAAKEVLEGSIVKRELIDFHSAVACKQFWAIIDTKIRRRGYVNNPEQLLMWHGK